MKSCWNAGWQIHIADQHLCYYEQNLTILFLLNKITHPTLILTHANCIIPVYSVQKLKMTKNEVLMQIKNQQNSL